MRPVKMGDRVTIVMTRRVSPIQSFAQPYILQNAQILHEPCDTGDYWAFLWQGYTFTINPTCTSFVGVVLEEEGKKYPNASSELQSEIESRQLKQDKGILLEACKSALVQLEENNAEEASRTLENALAEFWT